MLKLANKVAQAIREQIQTELEEREGQAAEHVDHRRAFSANEQRRARAFTRPPARSGRRTQGR